MSDKFSSVEELTEALIGFVHHLASRYCNPNVVMFEYDELVGELFLELVKGWNYYNPKDLPKEQMLALVRRMLDNRIAELRHKHYGTHRGIALSNLSIDADTEGSGLVEEELEDKTTSGPEDITVSNARVSEVYERLTDASRMVFEAVIKGSSQRLSALVKLSSIRACAVSNGRITIKPWIVADALLVDEESVKKSFREIRQVYAEVCK